MLCEHPPMNESQSMLNCDQTACVGELQVQKGKGREVLEFLPDMAAGKMHTTHV